MATFWILIGFVAAATFWAIWSSHRKAKKGRELQEKINREIEAYKLDPRDMYTPQRQPTTYGSKPWSKSDFTEPLEVGFVLGTALGHLEDTEPSYRHHQEDNFTPGGGSFGGAGASASWDPSPSISSSFDSSPSTPDFSDVISSSSSTADPTDN